VLGGHKGLYLFGQNVPTSSVQLLVLPILVCSRGYKRAREGEGPKSLMEGSNRVESHSTPPTMGRPTSPFIGQGEGIGYMRERMRRKRAFGVASSFAPCMGPADPIDDDGDGSMSWR
jgi:hypothetical protein